MLNEVMRTVRNYFDAEHLDGSFSIEGGTISLPFVSRYVLIEGSKFNDGLHAYPLSGLTNETFTGSMTAVNPPKDFLDLVTEIEQYVSKNPNSGYVSESFGGYSYQKGTKSNGQAVTWANVFSDRLKVWRKI